MTPGTLIFLLFKSSPGPAIAGPFFIGLCMITPGSKTREKWAPIPGTNGNYEASSLGRVRSTNRRVFIAGKKAKHYRTLKGKVLTLSTTPDGYLHVRLGKFGKNWLVHRAVLAAFEGESDLDVDHINCNPGDNRLTNLRYLDPVKNIKKAMGYCPHCGQRL